MIRNLRQFITMMAGNQYGSPRITLTLHLLQKHRDRTLIKAVSRLIEQNQRLMFHQCLHNRQLLPHTQRVRSHFFLRVVP